VENNPRAVSAIFKEWLSEDAAKQNAGNAEAAPAA